MSYLRNWRALSRYRNGTGYSRIHRGWSSRVTPTTHTVSPYVLDGCDAALTRMSTRTKWLSQLAEAEGFEPPDGVTRLSLSRRVH